MSILIRTYPIVRKIIQRITKKGDVSIFSEGYHTKPFEVKVSKPKVKPKYDKEFYDKYISKGREGFNRLTSEIYSFMDTLPEIGKFYSFLLKNKNIKEDKLRESGATKSLLSSINRLESKDRKKRGKARKEIGQFLEFGHFLIKNNLLEEKPDKIEFLLKNKFKVADKFKDILESPHFRDYLKLIKLLKEKNPKIFDLEDNTVSHRNLFKEALEEFASSSKLDDILKGNQKLIEDFNAVLELVGQKPLEREHIEKLLKDSTYRDHFFNELLKSLAKSTLNKKTYETLLNLAFSNDTHFFTTLLKSIVLGKEKYNMSEAEALALFFYVNGAGTKDFPLNYKHLNTVIRKITAETLEKGEFKPKTPEEEFYFAFFQALDSAISKLPDAKEKWVYRGEGLTSVTINARKGDLIIFDTPTSTTPYISKKVTVNQRYYDEDSGKTIEIKKTKSVGAKSFMSNFGKSVAQSKAILEGKKPELYEGQREDLKRALEEFGTLPSGALFAIKNSRPGFVKKIPSEFVGDVHKGYDESLIRPSASYKVSGIELEGEGKNPALVITIEPRTVSSRGDFLFRGILPRIVRSLKRIKPRRKEK